MKLAQRLNEVKYAVRDVIAESAKIEKQGHKVLKLNIGDPNVYDFDTPEYIKDALCRAVHEGKNSYSDSQGWLPLREAIVKSSKRRGFDSVPENVVVTSGLSEAVHLLFGAMVESGDNVIIPFPSYPLYDAFISYYGGEKKLSLLDEEDNWAPSVGDLRKNLDGNTRAIVLINPNNPTGALYPEKTLREVIDVAGEYGVPILADEIYDELVFGRQFKSMASLTKDVPIIAMNGLSKNYIAPGWRVGWVTFCNFPDDSLREAVMKLARVRLSSSFPAQVASAEALNNRAEYEKAKAQFLPKLEKRRDITFKRLNEIAGLSCVKPEGAFYAFPRINSGPWPTDKEFVLELLREKHVLTVYGVGFAEPPGTRHFRTVFLPDEQTLEEAFNRIEEFMKEKLK